MRKRKKDVSKLEPKALEGNFVSYTGGDNKYLVYVPNTRILMAVQDVIIKESEVGSIPDNTETLDLLDEGSLQLDMWHTDDGHQDDGNKEKQGTSTAIREEWHDAESVNTQETKLRRDTSDVEEAALDEEPATRGSLRDSESAEHSDKDDLSQSETVEEALEQAYRAEPRHGTRARIVPKFFGDFTTQLAVTEGAYVEHKTFYKAKLVTTATSGTGQGRMRSRHSKTVRLGT